MPAYAIAIRQGHEVAEGVEQQATARAARLSAVRSALALMLDSEGLSGPMNVCVSIAAEDGSLREAYEVVLKVKPIPHWHKEMPCTDPSQAVHRDQ